MTHEYSIAGMTCGSCVSKVKSELLKTPGIIAADVQLAAPQASITMDKHIPLATLQTAIGAGKYTITESGMMQMYSTQADATQKDSYYPIFLIFGYITGLTLVIEASVGQFHLMRWMGNFMGAFFLLFSFFKLLNLSGFAEGYGTYDVVARKITAYGFAYPFIELSLGIAYITGFEPAITNAVTLAVMGISSIGVTQSLLKKSSFQCACLGTIIKLPLSRVTLFEDLLMVAMSIVMLIIG
jgi:copper chaperone CopZ